MKRIILVVIVLIIAVGGWYAYKMYQQKTPDVVSKDADIVIDANDLIEAFDKDSAAANQKYLGKLIEVTGIAKSIDSSAVLLGDTASRSAVRCSIDNRHLNDYKKVKIGSSITMQGEYVGYEMEEMLGENLGTTVTLNFAGLKEKK